MCKIKAIWLEEVKQIHVLRNG